MSWFNPFSWFGDDGQQATNVLNDNQGTKTLMNQAGYANSPQMQSILQGYGSGNQSLSQALQSASSASDPNASQTQVNSIFTDPRTGTKAATDQVMSNPMYKGMWGDDSMQSHMSDQEGRLSKSGYSLQPEDYDAMGQASNNIARNYAQNDQGIAQALASRGLASGSSGAAGVAYSGLEGNKLEQLANNQMQVAQNRMQLNEQMLNNVRGQMMQNNQLAQGAIQGQYNRNANGVDSYQNMLKGSMGAADTVQNQNNEAFAQQQATKGASLGDMIKGGLGNYIGGLGSTLSGQTGGGGGGGKGAKGGGGGGATGGVDPSVASNGMTGAMMFP